MSALSPRKPNKDQALSLLRDRGLPIAAIVDVGVNTGTPELMKAFPDLEHFLFEPAEEFFPAIAKAYSRLKYRLFDLAVSDTSGSINLAVSAIEGGDVTHSAMTTGVGRPIKMTTLDDALARIPGPFLLKIDIDGHELKALAGATETLKRCSVVIVEAPFYELTPRLRAMEEAGFRLFDLSEPCYYDGAFWQCDAMFVRNDVFAEHFKDLQKGFEAQLYQQYR